MSEKRPSRPTLPQASYRFPQRAHAIIACAWLSMSAGGEVSGFLELIEVAPIIKLRFNANSILGNFLEPAPEFRRKINAAPSSP